MYFTKKITAVLLALCLLITTAAVGTVSASAETTQEISVQETVQGSAILHCFCWSYNTIKANLKAIAEAGYTAIQTSPVQPPKDYGASWTDTNGQWWKLYQPLDLAVTNGTTYQSWLGTKAELTAMCAEAETYGIKVIVDIVANHLANNGSVDTGAYTNYLHTDVNSELKQSEYFFDNYGSTSSESRFQMTHGHLGMPELNTANSVIQNKVLNLLKECVDCGVDGFRFDTAKHIELPTDDDSTKSDFWPTVINGINSYKSGLYIYGEVLGDAYSKDINKAYTTYMDLTDDYTSYLARQAVKNNSGSSLCASYYQKGISADQAVLWAESHDTYMNSDGNSQNDSNDTIVKTWAMVNSRKDATSLYFVRPGSMGTAGSDTTWKSAAVVASNKFKNAFEGKSEYLSSSGSVAYNERGSKGVVIVKTDGSGSVSLTAHKMLDGTYTDHVTGNTFTVENGVISGTVGSTGVAVVYNENDVDDPVISASTLYMKPARESWRQGNERYAMYVYNDSGNQWVDMTDTGNNGIYQAAVPEGGWTGVIFCRMNGETTENSWSNKWNQTIDLFPPGENDLFTVTDKDSGDETKYTGTWSVYEEPTTTVPTSTVPETTVPETTVPETTASASDTITVYAYNKLNNWSNVYVYYWSSSGTKPNWPGKKMEQGNAVWVADIPKDATGVIFNNGAALNTKQTVDITSGIQNNAQWVIKTTTTDGKYEVEEGPTYYLVGTPTDWGRQSGYALSLNRAATGEVQYQLSGVSLSAGDELKISDTKSKWYPGSSDAVTGNYTVTADGTYDVYFRPNGDGSSWHAGYFYLDNVTPYTITWVGDGGQTLATDTVTYGNLPAYSGETPSKAADEQYYYTFAGWTPEVTAATGDATYQATFTQAAHDWNISWNWGSGNNTASATFSCKDCGYSKTCEAAVTHTFSANGRINTASVTFNGEPYTDTVNDAYKPFVGYSLTIKGDIGVNFYMNLPDEDVASGAANVHFEWNGKSKDVKPAAANKAADNVYKVSCSVAAAEMTDTITATYGGYSKEYTVKGYADKILADETKYAKEQTLIKTMLNYGAYAQIVFNHNTGNLANAGIDYALTNLSDDELQALSAYPVPDKTAMDNELEGSGLTYHSMTLLLQDKVTLRYYYQIQDENYNRAIITGKDSGGVYVYYDYANIYPSMLDENTYFLNEAKQKTEGVSPLAYVNHVLTTSNDTDLRNVVTALYRYHKAAQEYEQPGNS